MARDGFFRLSERVALRGWYLIPHAYYLADKIFAKNLTDEEFELLMLCDAEHALPSSDLLESLIDRGIVEPCHKGEAPSEWSRFRFCENMYKPTANLMLTGKCNYNCLHCFNAADNAPLMSEWVFDDLVDLIAQARDCGLRAWLLTGGEPMVHPRFMDVIREIYRQGMMVFEINTNGFFITHEMLAEMREIGCSPRMKISFDGLGYHDWMRNRAGAERRTLDAIRLCVDEGFEVMVQTNLNRRNRDSMGETLELLDSMGVSQTRIIRTTEAPRWEQMAGDACMTFEEYYADGLGIARAYSQGHHTMKLNLWEFLTLHPHSKSYYIDPIRNCGRLGFRPSITRCDNLRSMIAITSDGEVVPCMQMSGYFTAYGLSMGNLHETRLATFLNGGLYPEVTRRPISQFTSVNEKCAACPHLSKCVGGCPALGMLYSKPAGSFDGFYHEDVTKCLFFENGWEKRIIDALPDWNNLSQR
ncbi:MAG: radical SAM protein [Atopobiaceae bacterium]|nr:radical SAM protein [Atopobiaceae bacterium]